MPRFKCRNKTCSRCDIVELIPTVRFKWNSDTRELETDEAICRECKQVRETLDEGSLTKMPWFKADNDRNNDNKRIRKYS